MYEGFDDESFESFGSPLEVPYEVNRLVGDVIVIDGIGEKKLLTPQNSYVVRFSDPYSHYDHCVVDADTEDPGVLPADATFLDDLVGREFVVVPYDEPDSEIREIVDACRG